MKISIEGTSLVDPKCKCKHRKELNVKGKPVHQYAGALGGKEGRGKEGRG
jgi:hypothetical protein